ncbi:hypothetical protein ACXYRK_02775 [Mycoplasma sp. AC1221]
MLLIFGIRFSYILTFLSSIFAIIFYSLKIVDISKIILILIYQIIYLYLFFISKNKQLSIAFIGMGASGKSTLIAKLDDFWIPNNFKILNDRSKIIKPYNECLKDLKNNAFKYQWTFFTDRLRQQQMMQKYDCSVIDRHLIEELIAHNVLEKMQFFNQKQKFLWYIWYKPLMNFILNSQPKTTLAFIILKNPEFIKNNRLNVINSKDIQQSQKRQNELINTEFMNLINKNYLDQQKVGRLLKRLLKHIKYSYIFIDEQWFESIPKIKKIILSHLNKYV